MPDDRYYRNLRRELAEQERAYDVQQAAEVVAAAGVIRAHAKAQRLAAARSAAMTAITAVINAGGTDEAAEAAGRNALKAAL